MVNHLGDSGSPGATAADEWTLAMLWSNCPKMEAALAQQGIMPEHRLTGVHADVQPITLPSYLRKKWCHDIFRVQTVPEAGLNAIYRSPTGYVPHQWRL